MLGAAAEDAERVAREYLGAALGRLAIAASRNALRQRLDGLRPLQGHAGALRERVRGAGAEALRGAHAALLHAQARGRLPLLCRAPAAKAPVRRADGEGNLRRGRAGALPRQSGQPDDAVPRADGALPRVRAPLRARRAVPRRTFTRLFHYAPSDADAFDVYHFGILSSYDVEPLFRRSRLDSLMRTMDGDANLKHDAAPTSALAAQVQVLEPVIDRLAIGT